MVYKHIHSRGGAAFVKLDILKKCYRISEDLKIRIFQISVKETQMKSSLFLAGIAGFLWGVWPAVTRFSPLSPGWLLVMLGGASLVVGGGLVFGDKSVVAPSAGAVLLGALAGFMNAGGTIAYGKLLTTPEEDISKFVPVVIMILVVVAILSGRLLHGEAITMNKIIGIALAMGAIYLINK